MRPDTGASLPEAIDHRSEMDLFRLTARGSLGAGPARSLDELLAGQVDWEYVLSAGGRHGVLPLMQVHLERREAVPESMRQALRERCARVVRSNLYLSTRLIEIIDALQAAGVPGVVLKGPAAAATLYNSLSLREFGDLDILVRRDDVQRASEVMESLGFAAWLEATGAQEEILRHVEYSRTFTRPADDLDLDLHWDLARSFFRGRVEAEALWSDTVTFHLHGTQLRCLSPELQLLSLCVHGAKHGPFPWPRLKWICDVAEFVRRSEKLDWGDMCDRAADLGCRRYLLFGLAVARPLLEDGLPHSIEQELEHEARLERLSGRIWTWLSSEGPVSISFGERVALDLALLDGPGSRISYSVRRILMPTKKDWRGRSLPRRFAFLYVPLRILRLAGRYLPSPWRLGRLLPSGVRRSRSHPDG